MTAARRVVAQGVVVIAWGNPRWQRLATWALQLHSPSCGWRVPTFREAWTGWVRW